MEIVHIVFQSSDIADDIVFGKRLAGVFATRELADRFVQTRKAPTNFWVVSYPVFEDLSGCEFSRTPKE